MHLETIEVQVVVMTVEDFESISEDQLDRIKKMERDLKNYNSKLKTFIQKYTGKKVNHTTLQEHLKNNKQ